MSASLHPGAATALASPPSTALSPVRFRDGHYQAQDAAAAWRSITIAGVPVTAMLPGWKPVGIYRRIAGVAFLELHHPDGLEGTWFLDPALDFIGNDLASLAPEVQAAIAAHTIPILRRVRDQIMLGKPPPHGVDTAGLADLNQRTIVQLIEHASTELAPPATGIALAGIRPDWVAIQVAGMSLSAAALRDCLAPNLQDQHIRVLNGGSYPATCPVTGVALRSITTIVEDRLSACRFECPAASPARMIYLCNNSAINERELFIPVINCVVALRPPELLAKLYARLLATMVKHAAILPRYFAQPMQPANIMTPHPDAHVGHVLWNELTGLDRICAEVPADRLPWVIVPNADAGTEIYGPTEHIFPEFTRVLRMPTDDVTKTVYTEGLTAMRVYDRYVSRGLATRVAAVAASATSADQRRAGRFAAEGRTVVLLGLRVQNRTIPDQFSIWCTVIQRLVARLGPLGIVIDGINARLDGDPTTAFHLFSPQSGRPAVLDELEIVIRLRAHFCDGAEVQIINLVGMPLARSLFWSQRALMFVAIWGAGLAKYRWIANRPGLVLSNRWNLAHATGDIGIYGRPDIMESPTRLDYIGVEHVTDIAGQEGFYANFTVDPAGLVQALDTMIDHVVTQRGPDPAADAEAVAITAELSP